MEFIKFSRDGVLRRSFYAKDPVSGEVVSCLMPLSAWESAVDPRAFLKSLHSGIGFEEGLTVAELLENLAPWADIMTGVACMDFPAFLAEARLPQHKGLEEVSHIALRYIASIQPVARFDMSGMGMREQADGARAFHIGKPVKSGKLRIEAGWSNHAMLHEEHRAAYQGETAVSLSFSPLSEWAHVPIIIETAALLYDETAIPSSAVYMGTRKALTRTDHPNVAGRKSGNGRTRANEIAIEIPMPTLFTTVIEGFLWDLGFDYSPVQRDQTSSELSAQVAELTAGLSENVGLCGLADAGLARSELRARAHHAADMARYQLARQSSLDLGLRIIPRVAPACDGGCDI